MLNQATTSHTRHSAEGHLAFLRRVTADDRFRAELEADPQAAMAAFGLHVDADQVPSMVTLPSPEGILDALIDVEEDGSGDGILVERWAGFFGS